MSFVASSLYIACQNGHLDIVLKLLDKNVNTDVNMCIDSGASPLYIACQNGYLDIEGDAPLSTHLFTFVLIFLSNSFSTMSKYPFWQAIYKGDA
jgi:hypothetical protein